MLELDAKGGLRRLSDSSATWWISMSSFYPILLDLQAKKALVVGGGKVARGRLRLFLNTELRSGCGEELTAELENCVGRKKIEFLAASSPRRFLKGGLCRFRSHG